VTRAAAELLQAFATSDLDTIARLCRDDVLLVGTDRDEIWHGRDTVVTSFADAFELSVRWLTAPVVGDGWLFGTCLFADKDGTETPARVTMIFRDGLLAHAHYSVAQ
jgi:SnoaL-like domain